jgi:hypothetical protein
MIFNIINKNMATKEKNTLVQDLNAQVKQLETSNKFIKQSVSTFIMSVDSLFKSNPSSSELGQTLALLIKELEDRLND